MLPSLRSTEGGITIDYKKLSKIVAARCRCSGGEAMSGIATAFLTLDQTRSETEQCAYLLRYGKHFVIHERMRSVEHLELPDVLPQRKQFDEASFLNAFSGDPEVKCILESITEGRSLCLSAEAIRWTLRQNNLTCSRSNARLVRERIIKEVKL